jgi:hypothetical protein
MVVVDFPSPAGVGVMAVTRMTFPDDLGSFEKGKGLILALYAP